jgi:hypothetical protein
VLNEEAIAAMGDIIQDKDITHGGSLFAVEGPTDSNVEEHLSQGDLEALRQRQRSQSGLADDDSDDGGDADDSGEDHHWLDRKCCQKWPRLCSFVFGVVLPLWALIFISLICGSILSGVEAPSEGRFLHDKRNSFIYYGGTNPVAHDVG